MLGKGSFGTVYIAINHDDGQEYAAKVIDISDGFNGKQQMKFLQESSTLHKLDHPSIVKFKGINLQSFKDPTILQPTIITELLPKGSLRANLIKEKGSIADEKWSATKKYIILLGISDAMRYLHKHSIIHRDLKPENIMMDENLNPKIADLGLSICLNSLSNSMNLKSQKGLKGTPLYMAPEVLTK